MRPIALIGALVLSALLTSGKTDAQWGKVPIITIAALARDARIPLAMEAVEFWNPQLTEIGAPFRLGAVTQTTGMLPTTFLTQLSAAVWTREPPPNVPERVKRMPGNIIIASSDGDFVSFSGGLQSGTKVIIGIRSDQLRPLSLPSVTLPQTRHSNVSRLT